MHSPAPRPREPLDNRESGLRASILESALELGVGSSKITQWMFSPVEEGDEDADEETVSPSLTYASTAPSSESSPKHPLHPGAPGKPALVPAFAFPDGREPPRAIHFDLTSSTPARAPGSPSPSPAPGSVASPTKRGNKLRKKWLPGGGDGDGAYLSDGGGRDKKERERERKEREKKEKKERKKKARADGGATEGESDGGYLSDMLARRRVARKNANAANAAAAADHATPQTDYDTDGYLSEATAKRRGLFRLNTRAPRKGSSAGDSPRSANSRSAAKGKNVPPVPALPPAHQQQLPIAQRFLRADSFDTARTATPSTARDSEDTWASSEREREPDMRSLSQSSVRTADGLIGAFRDAQSVRTPSIDALSTFNMLGPAAPPLPKGRPPPGPPGPTDVPTISVPRARPAPLDFTSGRHVPAPLHLSPSAASLRSQVAQQYLASPASDWSVVDGPTHSSRAATPTGAATPTRTEGEHGNLRGVTTLPPPSPTRRAQLVPPPTPPPRGPLPDVPSDVASTMDRLSLRPSLDGAAHPPPSISVSPSGPARAAADDDAVPTLAELAREEMRARSPGLLPREPARSQRAREAPFPVSPVGASRATSPLPRAVSPLPPQAQAQAQTRMQTQAMRAPRVPRFPAKAASLDEYYGVSGPAGVDAQGGARWTLQQQQQQQGYARGMPRSASAIGMAPRDVPSPIVVDGHSHLDMSDEEDDDPADEDLQEVSRDFADDDDDDDDAAHEYPPDDSLIPAADRPLSEYADDASQYPDDEGERPYSVFSEGAESRRSFLDPERSADARAKFVRRVEAMYGQEVVPPVPYLSPNVRRGPGVIG